MASIAESDDIPGALAQAVEQLKQQEGYLFTQCVVPTYASGTGTCAPVEHGPTLAGALRERFEKL
jgi:hypothetical protein